MSIYAKVNAGYDEVLASADDDYDTSPIFAGLTEDELRIWLDECALDEELRAEHGYKPDFYDIVEREIYARGIEARPVV